MPGSIETEAPRTKDAKAEPNRFKRMFKILGPGLISGASDDDPSGIVTYSSAGAAFGFTTLWMAVVTLPMAISIQYICSKIGLVTGRGLSEVIPLTVNTQLKPLLMLPLH